MLKDNCGSFPPASEREAGWITPRPGQKKTGKRSALSGPSIPSEGPYFFAWNVRKRSASATKFRAGFERSSENAALDRALPCLDCAGLLGDRGIGRFYAADDRYFRQPEDVNHFGGL